MNRLVKKVARSLSHDNSHPDLRALSVDGSLAIEDALKDVPLEDIDPDPTSVLWEKARTTRGQACGEMKARESEDDWGIVRVFISSTFTDMHQERETLVNDLFPGLKLFCKQRQLHLMYTDLRWGVPKDTTGPTTIRTCLSEIDRCKRDNGFPIFLWLGGERYGWIPSATDVEPDIQARWGWVPGMSITAMEVLEGALRITNPRSIFAFRDAAFLNSDDFRALGPRTLARFADVEWENDQPTESRNLQMKACQDRLKTEICDTFDTVLKYNVKVVGVDEHGNPKFAGLNVLCEWARHHLENIIDDIAKQTAPSAIDPDHQTLASLARRRVLKERAAHSKIVCEIRPVFAGRVDLLSQLLSTDSEAGVMLVEGEEGVGMTATMAKLADNAAETGMFVISHFAGAAPESVDIEPLVDRLDRELRAMFELDVAAGDDLETFESKCARLHSSLDQADKDMEEKDAEKMLFIIVDGLHMIAAAQESPGQLNEMLAHHEMSHVRWVLGGRPGQHTTTITQAHKCPTFTITNLPREEQCVAISNNLAVFNKKLHPLQMDMMLDKNANMLWASLAAHELIRFGVFEKVTELIEHLPTTIADIHGSIFNWLEQRHGRDFVQRMFGLLAVSRFGLSETELKDLMFSDETDDATHEPTVPAAAVWSRLYDDTTFLLQEPGLPSSRGTGLITFLHTSTCEAAVVRYLDDRAFEVTLRLMLAKHMSANASLSRRASEVPYQFSKAGALDRLKAILVDDSICGVMCDRYRADLMRYWRVFDSTYVKAAEAYLDRVKVMRQDESMPPPRIAEMCLTAGNILDTMGQFNSSLEIFQIGIEVEETSLKDLCEGEFDKQQGLAAVFASEAGTAKRERVWRLNVMHANRGRVLMSQNELKQTREAYEHSLALLALMRDDPRHARSAIAANEALAACLMFMGELPLALEKLFDVLESLKHVPQSELHVAGVLLNVGLAYRRQNNLELSRNTYERALAIHLAHHGDMHEDVIDLLMNLGTVLIYLEEYAKAMTHLERGLEVSTALLGKQHYKTALMLDNLAVTELSMPNPDFERIRSRVESSLAILTEVFGDTAPQLCPGLRVLSDVLHQTRDCETLNTIYEWQLRVQEANGLDSSNTKMGILANKITITKQRGISAATTGNLEQAKICFDESLRITETHFGSQKGPLATALFNSGVVRSQLGETEDAIAHIQQAVQLAEECYGDAHSETRRFQTALQQLTAQ